MKIQKFHQELPKNESDKLRSLHRNKEWDELANLIYALRCKGWTLTAMAFPLGVTRERIRQLYNKGSLAGAEYWLPHISDAPLFETAKERGRREVRERKSLPLLSDDVINYLNEEYRIVKHVNGVSSKELKERSKNFTHLLAFLLEQGHTIPQLAEALKVRYRTISFRLGRYGFRSLPPSQSQYRVKG